MSAKRFAVFLPDGQVVREYTGVTAPEIEPGQTVVEVAIDATDYLRTYYDAGKFKPIPPKPAENYVFNYTAKAWEFDSTGAWQEVRQRRNTMLAASDWTQLPDVPLETKSAWTAYRQALRDVTSQADPLNIVWPQVPG